jgi:hypothetical protein
MYYIIEITSQGRVRGHRRRVGCRLWSPMRGAAAAPQGALRGALSEQSGVGQWPIGECRIVGEGVEAKRATPEDVPRAAVGGLSALWEAVSVSWMPGH